MGLVRTLSWYESCCLYFHIIAKRQRKLCISNIICNKHTKEDLIQEFWKVHPRKCCRIARSTFGDYTWYLGEKLNVKLSLDQISINEIVLSRREWPMPISHSRNRDYAILDHSAQKSSAFSRSIFSSRSRDIFWKCRTFHLRHHPLRYSRISNWTIRIPSIQSRLSRAKYQGDYHEAQFRPTFYITIILPV